MKALALVSGGLDSILATQLMRNQGIDVIGLEFRIPFYLKKTKSLSDLGIEIKQIDISNDFLEIIKNPQHGFGSNINPCIDCKILMFRKAKELMEKFSAKFVITGEVLGQRPMSQHKQALITIAKQGGLEGLVLRPLSARLLPETIPEKEGWVSREKMLDFNGRTRSPQMELAQSLGIQAYSQPAGGCLLTDPQFSKRLKDLIGHQELSVKNTELLKIGRHFRLSPKAKLIVGRNENENRELEDLAQEGDYLFMPPEDLAGATSLGKGEFNKEIINLSCKITSRYCDLNAKTSVAIIYRRATDKEIKILRVCPIEENQLTGLRI